MDILIPNAHPLGESSRCLREADHTFGKSWPRSTAPSASSEKPGFTSSISIMKEAVCNMGIPEDVVQLAIDVQRLDHSTDFSKVTDLLEAADRINTSEEKKKLLESKLHEAEKTTNARVKETDAVTSKLKDENYCTSSASASPSAEMLKAAEASPVRTDKSRLREKVKKLARENQKLRQRKFCRACKEVELATSGVTFLPCGHFITCEECSEKYDDCPACGKSIMGTVRTFLS